MKFMVISQKEMVADPRVARGTTVYETVVLLLHQPAIGAGNLGTLVLHDSQQNDPC